MSYDDWKARQAELLADANELAEMDNAAHVAEWEANAAYRDARVAQVAAEMVALGASREDVAGMAAEAAARPNEWWGELREGRVPPARL